MAAGRQLHLPTATFEELCGLPGVGPALARRIIERRSREPLAGANDLIAVPGMTSALVERLRPYFAQTALPEATAESPDHFAPPPEPDRQPSTMTEETTEADPEACSNTAPGLGSSVKREAEPAGTEEAANADVVATENAQPRRGRAVNLDADWPRSYNGVNPAVLFGEADHALVRDCPPPLPVKATLAPGHGALLVVLGALLGAALALSTLYALNRGLYFVPRQEWERSVAQPLATVQAETVLLTDQVARLEAVVTTFESSIASTDSRVRTLEAAADHLEEVQAALDSLRSDVETVQARTEQFGSFLEGVRSALENLVP